ncbi:MAG: NADH-quinone oxidoreductase subunit C [Janthinobacterium lividum]
MDSSSNTKNEIAEFSVGKFELESIDIDNFIGYIIKPENLIALLSFVKNSPILRFTILTDLFAADFPSREKRFEVVYSLLSLKLNQRLLIKVFTNSEDLMPSVTSIFDSSCWYEREAFDMFGIKFNNCPDMRRILTDYGFAGHPLRKDFPLTGHFEVEYNQLLGQVVYKAVELEQEFRMFDFMSPWRGPKDTRHIEPNILPGDEKATK